MAFRFSIVTSSVNQSTKLVVIDTNDSNRVVFDRSTHDIYYDSTSLQNGFVNIIQSDASNPDSGSLFKRLLSNTENSSGTTFTSSTFETFARENLGNRQGGGAGTGGARTTTILTGSPFADFAALEASAQANLSLLHNDDAEVTLATVTDEAVYQWSGEDTPLSYTNSWIIREDTVSSQAYIDASILGQDITYTRANGGTTVITIPSSSLPPGVIPDVGGVDVVYRFSDRITSSSLTLPQNSQRGYMYHVDDNVTLGGQAIPANSFIIATAETPDPNTFSGNWEFIEGLGVRAIGRLTGVIDDLAFRNYLRGLGTPWKEAVRAATIANLSLLSGTQAVDGIDLNVNDRVLVKNQDTPETNGIYIVQSGTWTRATDFNSRINIPRAIIPVLEGDENELSEWELTTTENITVGTTELEFDVHTEQEQSDWAETNSDSPSFINNKPTIPSPRTDEEIRDVVGSTLVAGSNVSISVNDAANTITISSTGGGGGTPPHPSPLYMQSISDQNASSVDTGTAFSSNLITGTFNIPTFTGNMYLGILTPESHAEYSQIVIGGINQIAAFTKTDNARTISGQSYRFYVSNNLLIGSIVSNEPIQFI